MPGVDGTFSWRSRKTGETLTVSKLRSIIAIYRKVLEREHSGPKKASTVNTHIRNALQAAGDMWIKVFLPKRFDQSYARGVLGYRATKKYEDEKVEAAGSLYSFTEERGFSEAAERVLVASPQPTPFVLTGTSRAGVLSGARVEARVTAKKWVLKVHVNPGKISFTKQYDNFMKIPAIEYQRVVWEVQNNLKKLTSPASPEVTPEELPERQVSDG
jgi:hypothetical protein